MRKSKTSQYHQTKPLGKVAGYVIAVCNKYIFILCLIGFLLYFWEALALADTAHHTQFFRVPSLGVLAWLRRNYRLQVP